MTGQEILLLLKTEGFIVEKGEDDYILSNKLKRLPEEVSAPLAEVPKAQTKDLKQFAADCMIPFRAKTAQGGHYQLNAISDYGRKAFNKILLEGEYAYEDMVKATRKYYSSSSMARVTLTNYFKLNVFENVMKEFLEKKPSDHSKAEEGSTWSNPTGRTTL